MNKPIKIIIEQYGNGKINGGILITRPLAATVQFAELWPDISEQVITKEIICPRTLYLIFEKEKLVGGVDLLPENLDCWMSPGYRGKGIFSKAMKECILPHILL